MQTDGLLVTLVDVNMLIAFQCDLWHAFHTVTACPFSMCFFSRCYNLHFLPSWEYDLLHKGYLSWLCCHKCYRKKEMLKRSSQVMCHSSKFLPCSCDVCYNTRSAILACLLCVRPVHDGMSALEWIAQRTTSYSGSDLRELCAQAAQRPVQDAIRSV